MKASLLADDEDIDTVLDQRITRLPSKADTSQEICSPRLPISATHSSKPRSLGTVKDALLQESCKVSFFTYLLRWVNFCSKQLQTTTIGADAKVVWGKKNICVLFRRLFLFSYECSLDSKLSSPNFYQILEESTSSVLCSLCNSNTILIVF